MIHSNNKKAFVYATLNIYGNKIKNMRHEISNYLDTHFIDCLVLTEAHQDNDNYSLFKEFNINSSFHPETKRGIIILTKKIIEIKNIDIVVKGHIIGMKLRARNFNFYMVGVYNKTACFERRSKEILTMLYDYLSLNNGALICLGDFNVNMLSNTKSNLQNLIYKILKDKNLIDIGHIFGDASTWRGRGNRAASFSRIDLILTNFTKKIFDFALIPTTSDHDLVVFKYYFDCPFEKNASICKDFILNNEKFINKALKVIADVIQENCTTLINSPPRNKTVTFSDIRASEKKANFSILQYEELTIFNLIIQKVKKLHDEFDRQNKKYQSEQLNNIYKSIAFYKKHTNCNAICAKKCPFPNTLDCLNEKKNELKNYFYEKKEKQNARIKFYYMNKYGKISTKMFNEIKPEKYRKKITFIDSINGKIENDNEISRILTNDLKSKVSIEKSFTDIKEFVLRKNVNLKCEFIEELDFVKNVEIKEVKEALKKMKSHAAPGISGCNKSFFNFLLLVVPNIFCKAIQIYIDKGAKAKQFEWLKLRKIIFFHKNNKESFFAKDFRPISLLETFYKIVCKIIINRLDNYGDRIFNAHQYGFVRNRNPSSATRTLEIIGRHCEERNINHQVVFLDNSAAFDRLGIKPILDILIEMSIPKKYVQWIESLVRGGLAYTEVNAVKSEKFEIFSPSAQGSPLAATLYAIAHNIMQVCYDNLDCNWKLSIEDIKIGQISFADDSAIATKITKKEDLIDIFDFFKQFEQLIGIKLNTEKTEILAFGSNTEQINNWINELKCGKMKNSVKHLGITICNKAEETVDKTCKDITDRMHTSLEFFVKTKVDLFKRKTLIEMAFHSKFNHFFQSCSLPECTLKKIWHNIINAMRANKLPITARAGRPLISKSRIPANYNVGGLQMTDTLQKYKSISIEANFKILYNSLTNKNDFISLYIRKKLKNNFAKEGSKGLQNLACKLPNTLLFLKDALIFLSKLIEKLEKDQLFWSASSLRSSIHNVLWFRFNNNQLKVLDELNLTCIGQLYLNSDILKQRYGTLFDTQIDYLINNISKPYNCNRISTASHVIIVLNTYKEEKRFRPKIILKKEYKKRYEHMYKNAPSLKTRIRDQLFIIDEKSLKEAYSKSLKMPLSTIYRSFNFQILNRTLFTAEKAFKCRINDNDKCIKCNDKEDTSHLLIDCDNYAYIIWTELNSCVKIISTNAKESISWKNIIFHKTIKGIEKEDMQQLLILIQILKFSIYSKRKEIFRFSEIRIRAHLISSANSTINLLERTCKKFCYIIKLRNILENRLTTNVQINY